MLPRISSSCPAPQGELGLGATAGKAEVILHRIRFQVAANFRTSTTENPHRKRAVKLRSPLKRPGAEPFSQCVCRVGKRTRPAGTREPLPIPSARFLESGSRPHELLWSWGALQPPWPGFRFCCQGDLCGEPHGATGPWCSGRGASVVRPEEEGVCL